MQHGGQSGRPSLPVRSLEGILKANLLEMKFPHRPFLCQPLLSFSTPFASQQFKMSDRRHDYTWKSATSQSANKSQLQLLGLQTLTALIVHEA